MKGLSDVDRYTFVDKDTNAASLQFISTQESARRKLHTTNKGRNATTALLTLTLPVSLALFVLVKRKTGRPSTCKSKGAPGDCSLVNLKVQRSRSQSLEIKSVVSQSLEIKSVVPECLLSDGALGVAEVVSKQTAIQDAPLLETPNKISQNGVYTTTRNASNSAKVSGLPVSQGSSPQTSAPTSASSKILLTSSTSMRLKALKQFSNPLPLLVQSVAQTLSGYVEQKNVDLSKVSYCLSADQFLEFLQICQKGAHIKLGPYTLSGVGKSSAKIGNVIAEKQFKFSQSGASPSLVFTSLHHTYLSDLLPRLTHLSLALEAPVMLDQFPVAELSQITHLELASATETNLSLLADANLAISNDLPSLLSLSKLSTLAHISVHGFNVTSSKSLEDFARMVNLSTLTFDGCIFTDSMESLATLSRLQNLVIRNCLRDNDLPWTVSVEALKVIAALPALTSLTLPNLVCTDLGASVSIPYVTALTVEGTIKTADLTLAGSFPKVVSASLSLVVGGDTLHAFLLGAQQLTRLVLLGTATASSAEDTVMDPEFPDAVDVPAMSNAARQSGAGSHSLELMLSTYGIAMSSALSHCSKLEEAVVQSVSDLQLLQHLVGGLARVPHLKRLRLTRCVSTAVPPPHVTEISSNSSPRTSRSSISSVRRPGSTSIGGVRVASVMRHLIGSSAEELVLQDCGGLFEQPMHSGGLTSSSSLSRNATMAEGTETQEDGDLVLVRSNSLGGDDAPDTPTSMTARNISLGGSKTGKAATPFTSTMTMFEKESSGGASTTKGPDKVPFLARAWPALRKLTLASMDEVADEQIVAISTAHPRLERLEVIDCPRVKQGSRSAVLPNGSTVEIVVMQGKDLAL